MTSAKEILKQFLQEYLEWAEGDSGGGSFGKGVGLCSNLEDWLFRESYEWGHYVPVLELFKNLLNEYSYDPVYPFGGEAVYAEDQKNGRMHKNSERIAWVERTIARLEK